MRPLEIPTSRQQWWNMSDSNGSSTSQMSSATFTPHTPYTATLVIYKGRTVATKTLVMIVSGVVCDHVSYLLFDYFQWVISSRYMEPIHTHLVEILSVFCKKNELKIPAHSSNLRKVFFPIFQSFCSAAILINCKSHGFYPYWLFYMKFALLTNDRDMCYLYNIFIMLTYLCGLALSVCIRDFRDILRPFSSCQEPHA